MSYYAVHVILFWHTTPTITTTTTTITKLNTKQEFACISENFPMRKKTTKKQTPKGYLQNKLPIPLFTYESTTFY